MSTKHAGISVDREAVDIDDAAPSGPMAMEKIDPAQELAKFEAAAQLLAKLVPASIQRTKSQDWVKMGNKVYLQATGIERLAPLWGLAFDAPKVTREDYPDGTFGYVVSGWVRSRFGLMHVVGGRSSADPFFDQFDEDRPSGWSEMAPGDKAVWKAAHKTPPDPMDVQKSAVTNWMTRGGSMACGLRGLTMADLEANGIRGVTTVEFSKGSKGGETAPQDMRARQVEFGNDILRRTGGDKEAARDLLREVTSDKDFKGFTTVEKLTKGWQFDRAVKKLQAHPVFGDAALAAGEPGDEDPAG